ncbi:hypothetical protein SCP_0404420 [Sparassis crispa]|uniref:Uncharacterized protein n=1 Tax=Sparassis crispa TaxID=139825 RepID=A0A401GIN2_9APHY|nr:hypothetical protein SCP_0404420 [Sparassis crispa]GBE82064.1 hypothetical protein SCP_0404420 [Sparassis crispa]
MVLDAAIDFSEQDPSAEAFGSLGGQELPPMAADNVPPVPTGGPIGTAVVLPTTHEAPTFCIPVIDTALKFIHELKSNPLVIDEKLDKGTQWRLHHPLTEPMALTPDEQLSIKLFLADTDGSEKIYNEVREAILEWHPEDKILTHHCVKRKVAEISGITPILEDMCPNSCISYTGPFKDLDICPYCHKHCYDPILLASCGDKKPRQQFNTFPVGPQIQARFRSPESVADMQHQKQIMADVLAELQLSGKLDIIEDIPHGSDFWDAYQHGQIAPDDVCLIFSMDGAQLYEHKASNCWIYIWILVDVSPDKHYKKKYIMPGAIVPGPNKPKNSDSLLFPGLHHVTALQNEGLAIWDASQDVTFKSHPWIFLAEADAIGAPELTGYVGHHGKKGCRNRCGRKGRRKPGGSHYYAVCLKPDNYSEHGCDDDDYEPSDLPTASPAQYKQDLLSIQASTSTSNYEARRLETGLSKSSIFCGLAPSCTLPVPLLFPGDIMHLFGINIPDLLQKLWRGLMECDTKNEDSCYKAPL